MNYFSIGQPELLFSRQILSALLLIFVVIAGVAMADLSQPNPPERSRTLNYPPLTNKSSTQSNSQNRTLSYEPVRRQATVQQQSVDSQRYTVNRPTPDPQGSSTSLPADRSRGYDSNSSSDELLPLPPPEGPITNSDAIRQLVRISQMSVAAKTGETIPPPGDTTQNNATPGNEGNAPATPGTNAGTIDVDSIFQAPAESNNWFALIEGSSTPIPLAKRGDRFFQIDNGKEVFPRDKNSNTDAEPTKDGTKPSLADDQARNAVLLIVTIMAVLTALGIGFLAFDYKLRWEQEVVAQNNRLLGTSASHGAFGDLDSLEPETLSFSPHDYRPLDDSFDHTFRTIA